jgi:hypothetical protein
MYPVSIGQFVQFLGDEVKQRRLLIGWTVKILCGKGVQGYC